MIYTLTFNPALDYILTPEDSAIGSVTRTVSEKLLPGGKGINVSIVLNNLGIKTTALGFTAGFTGYELERLLCEMGVSCDFVKLDKGRTRINVKIRSNPEREINARGPKLEDKHLAALFEKLDRLTSGDILVLAGSVPNGVNRNIYRIICERLADRDIKIVLDAEGSLLEDSLCCKPFLIKPNHHELGAIFSRELTTKSDIAKAAAELRCRGARNVFVSMAADGGILAGEDGSIFYSPAPKGTLINSTGAGDSAVAGFLAGYFKTNSLVNALMWGLACGSASAFSENLAQATDFSLLLRQISEDSIVYL